jgi:DNA helicase-2/ATP-dependent DNA helicase PcrA
VQDLEEERRLAYVGLTRARERLYLTRAEVRSSWGAPQYFSASRFAEEIPADLVEWRRSETSTASLRAKADRYGSRAGGWSSTYGARSGGDDDVYSRTGAATTRRIPPSPPGEAASAGLGLEVGDRVSHDQYGLGTVVVLEGDGKNAVAKVDFGGAGVKRLLLRFAHMTKL